MIIFSLKLAPQSKKSFDWKAFAHPKHFKQGLHGQAYFLWNKGYEFSSFLPQDKEEDFNTVIMEGLEMAKHQVRVAL